MLKIKKRKMEKLKAKGELEEAAKEEMKKELKEYKQKLTEEILQGKFDSKYLFSPISSQQLGNKARSFYILKKNVHGTSEFRAIIGYNNNSLELWSLKTTRKKQEGILLKHDESNMEASLQKIQEIGWWGHKTPIRVCILSSNDQLLLTASTGTQ
jgi:hypothetical protein